MKKYLSLEVARSYFLYTLETFHSVRSLLDAESNTNVASRMIQKGRTSKNFTVFFK
jgi:hypothetical protein